MNKNLGEEFACKSVEVSKVKSRKAKKPKLVRKNKPQRAVETENFRRETEASTALA
jgi:hypothetical protein